MVSGNDLVEHQESCIICQALENLRDRLNDFVKLRIEDVFDTIDKQQLECYQGD